MPSLGVSVAPRVPCFVRTSGLRPLQSRTIPAVVRCSCNEKEGEEKSDLQKTALPAAALLSALLLFGATPDDAFAARSGGRMGGSSFRR